MSGGRVALDGATSPHPLADGLPALFRSSDEAFLERLCGALDQVLAPVLVTLDSLDAYLDPALAPDDFLAWLGGWMGLRGRFAWPEPAWRSLIAESSELYATRGMAKSVQRIAELFSGGTVTVQDPGGSAVLADPDGAAPTAALPQLRVIVRVRGGRIAADDTSAMAGLREVVRAAVPAHLALKVEVTG